MEGEDIQVEPQALTLIARQATGSMRDAISLLDQLASSDELITLEMAQTVLGTAASQAVIDILDALLNQQPAQGLDLIHRTLDAGSDPRTFARQIVDYLRGLLLIRLQNAEMVDATGEVRSQMEHHAQALETAELLRIIQTFNRAAVEARAFWQPALPLEMAFVESLNSSAAQSINPSDGESAPAEMPRKVTERIMAPKSGPARGVKAAAQANHDEPSPEDRQATRSLTQVWPRILEIVRLKNPQANGLLRSAKSRYIRGNHLLLFFSSDILKLKMEREENLEAVVQALSQVFERDLFIECQVDATVRDAIPPEVENDGLVATTLRDLGGEIVDI